tara:strand:+ start:472 stop:1881 length:1410 start_codon:yes stop_codon:yes gene_type:complete
MHLPSKKNCALIFILMVLFQAKAERPNIIYILADDLGWGDLGCYGQKTLKTTNLDRLAKEGMRFTRHYAGSTVCAPSRCVLMTGLHTGHARIRGNGKSQLLKTDITFAKLLQQNGYQTGCFGKWGIGNPPPLNDPYIHGFEEFYGYINMYHAHNYYPEFLVHNGKKIKLRNILFDSWRKKRAGLQYEGAGVSKVTIDYAPKLIADKLIGYIRKASSNKSKPFFIYYALNIPHANNEAGSEDRIDNDGMRVPDWGSHANLDIPDQEKGFARMIDYIDKDVGRILSVLKELNIDDKTIVMFSSDNGPHQEGGHKMEFFNSNSFLRGMKRDLYEGGLRVPFLVRWPGHVPAKKVSHHISGFQDIFPTMLEIAKVRSKYKVDGISITPTLLDKKGQKQHNYLYWEFEEHGGSRAILKGNWKGVRRNTKKNPNAPIEIYNLNNDIAETTNLASVKKELVAEFKLALKREHDSQR